MQLMFLEPRGRQGGSLSFVLTLSSAAGHTATDTHRSSSSTAPFPAAVKSFLLHNFIRAEKQLTEEKEHLLQIGKMASDPEKADAPLGTGSGDEANDQGEGELSLTREQLVSLQQQFYHPDIVRRVKALKNNQMELLNIETEFYKEIHALEVKYLAKYQPLFEKRALIVNGEYEPTDQESEFAQPELDSEISEAMDKMKLEESKPVGIPGFWPHIFRNVELLSDMTEEHDFPVLNHLTDIKVEPLEDPMGFTLNFHFSPNEYFTNTVLTKTYEMSCAIDKDDPFSFEGTEIIKTKGCTIDWNKGKNVTVQTIKKKQKHKQRGSIRTICKTIDVPSFFQFFSPPEPPAEGEEVDDETQIKLTSDFEVGQYIRERIVPRAVLYFTGEALDDDDEDYDDDEEEEEEEEEEDEDEDEARVKAKKNKVKGKGNAKQQAEECKQQ